MAPLDPGDPEALERPIVRARYCQHLVELLAEEGVPAEAVLEGTGLTPAALAERDGRIGYGAQLAIYRNARAHSRRPDLGFRLARRQRISDHGVFGYAIQSSADLAQALRITERYLATIGPLLELAVDERDGVTSLAVSEVMPLGDVARMAREEHVAALVDGLLGSSEPATRPAEIRLDLPADGSEGYADELGCPVRFGCSRAEIRIDTRHLSRPLAFSDEETAGVCERRLADMSERLGGSAGVVADVRRLLVGDPGSFPRLEAVARRLGMSGRTLRRRLAEAGTSFRAVHEDVRRGLALDYLQRSNLSIDEIAALLGFTETPNFYRAFKRWTGRPPSAFR